MNRIITTLTLLLVQTVLFAQTTVHSVFGDHMVLQQSSEVKIWGKDKAKTKINITTSWGATAETKTNQEGKWEVFLQTPKGSYEVQNLHVKGTSEVALQDILIGEVWLASGQSNMQMPLIGYNNQPVIGSTKKIVEANKPNHIRLFQVNRKDSDVEVEEIEGKWTLCNAQTVRQFSVVAYIFGQQLAEQLNVPVGLIHSSRGATKAECWINNEDIKTISIYKDKELPEEKNVEKRPSVFYNKMIHPIVGYTIKGAIWYQGEANKMESAAYPEVMKTLISSWRKEWGQGDFPFYMCEIAPFNYGNPSGLEAAKLRESQYQITQENENVELVSTADLGAQYFIHPPKKIEIGERLSYIALDKVYQVPGFEFNYPTFGEKEIIDGKIKVKIQNAKTGLTSFQEEIRGFEIAGEDGEFYPAKAKLIFRKHELWVSSEEVAQPKYVRYAFSNYHEANLFSADGFPVYPFRSDKDDEVAEN